MSAREIEAAAVEALRHAQEAYDAAVLSLKAARERVKSMGTDGSADSVVAQAEENVRSRKTEFAQAAEVLQQAATALLHAKAAFDAAEVALRVARVAYKDPGARQAAIVAVQEAEVAVERGRAQLNQAGRDLAHVRTETQRR